MKTTLASLMSTASLSTVLLLSAANAADLGNGMKDTRNGVGVNGVGGSNWSGVWAGGTFGYTTGTHNMDAELGSGGNGESVGIGVDSFGSTGLEYGAEVGADMQRGDFVFGVLGGYTFSGVDTKAKISGIGGNGDGSVSTYIEHENYPYVAGRVGYSFGNTMLYGLAGWQWQTMKYGYSVSDGEGGSKGESIKVDYSGPILGVGTEFKLSERNGSGVYLDARYTHTFSGDETVVKELGLKDSVDTDSFKVGIKYRFGR